MTDICKAGENELNEIFKVYEDARAFMAANGNPKQWGISGYPSDDLLREDVKKQRLYIIKRGGRIAAAFVLFEGEEPTYQLIEDGAWPSDKPYLTIHRLGSLSSEHGIGVECIDFAVKLCREKKLDLRADTHEDNKPVRHILEKYGFTYCGIIHVADGTRRRAYQLEITKRG